MYNDFLVDLVFNLVCFLMVPLNKLKNRAIHFYSQEFVLVVQNLRCVSQTLTQPVFLCIKSQLLPVQPLYLTGRWLIPTLLRLSNVSTVSKVCEACQPALDQRSMPKLPLKETCVKTFLKQVFLTCLYIYTYN